MRPRDLPQQPRGPRAGSIPILIGGNGPKEQRAAVRHADVYSCYIEERPVVEEVAPRLEALEAICAEAGRDPASIGRSVGLSVQPLEPAGGRPGALTGSAGEIADAIRTFREGGFTQVELMYHPGTMEALEALAPVVEAIDAD